MILLFDAHNHLHDQRPIPSLQEIVPVMQEAGIARCVVNGTCEEDWPRVAELAEQFPGLVQPSFGLHPWKVPSRTSGWLEISINLRTPAWENAGSIAGSRSRTSRRSRKCFSLNWLSPPPPLSPLPPGMGPASRMLA